MLFSRSPVLRHQAVLARSCSQLEAIVGSTFQQQSSIPEIQIRPSTPSRQGASSVLPTPPYSAARDQAGGNGPSLPHQSLYLQRRGGRAEKDGEGVRRDSEGLLRLVRSHSEPGLGSSTDTGDSDTITKCFFFWFYTFNNITFFSFSS